MKVLFVVQPLTGDRIDGNHVRIEHHHSEGLSKTYCMIDGVERFVRCTSRQDTYHPITKTRSILVHLQPLPQETWRPRCNDIDSTLVLRSVSEGNWWPSVLSYRQWIAARKGTNIHRLIQRKQKTLIRRGYVITTKGVPFITDKGRKYLGQTNA